VGDNIKKKNSSGTTACVFWIKLTQDQVQWWVRMNIAKNPRVSHGAGISSPS